METPLDWRPLIESLRYNRHFTHISVEHCRLSSDAVQALSNVVCGSQSLKFIVIKHLTAPVDAFQHFFDQWTVNFIFSIGLREFKGNFLNNFVFVIK